MCAKHSWPSNQSTPIGVIVAVIAGLLIGGFLLYRIISGNTGRPAKQIAVAAVPAVNSESTPSAVKPPPEADVLPPPEHTNKITNVASSAAKEHKHEKRHAVEPSPSPDTLPALIGTAAAPQADEAAAHPVGPVTPPATSTANRPAGATSSVTKRRAVQETEAETSPVPVSPLANEPTASGQQTPSPAGAPGLAAPNLATKPVGKPAYDGPEAGMATWTGKLEKNETLTITGGTSSIGVLSGAGLPGVPVRLIIDQTNLGFVEMPNAANGYRRVVLKSHSHHDKITLHWTVVQ